MRLKWTRPASADLIAIEAYLDTIEAGLAVDAVGAIVAATQRLCEYPELGQRLNPVSRSFAAHGTPYRLIYRVVGNVVEILRIHHARENWRA